MASPLEHREVLCIGETPPPGLPSDCQKRVWPNGPDTFRSDYLSPACHLLPGAAQRKSQYKKGQGTSYQDTE